MEIRDLLTKYQFDGNNAKIIRGSATAALKASPKAKAAIQATLMDALDSEIPSPRARSTSPS
jgi:elongation factor Tu